MVPAAGGPGVHAPAVELLSRSKLSCLSWNKYIQAHIASSDYEGGCWWGFAVGWRVRCGNGCYWWFSLGGMPGELVGCLPRSQLLLAHTAWLAFLHPTERLEH